MATAIVAAFAWLMTPAQAGFASPQDEADWYDREANGHHRVVERKALIDSYKNGVIGQNTFEAQMWDERPSLMSILYAKHGTLTDCFLLDLLFAESNYIIGYGQSQEPIFFDTTQYLDSGGQILPGMARDYNAAVSANSILTDALDDWANEPCDFGPVNDRCCATGGAVENCDTVKTGYTCYILQGETLCSHGSHPCP